MTKITAEDRILIKNLRIEKQWGARRMITEFPNKGWSKTSLNRLCQKIDADGTIARKPGSGCPRSVRTMRNIRRVSELICSQEDNPHSHKSPREIERETGISRGTVQRIVKKDLQLWTYKRLIGQVINENCKLKRQNRSQQLLDRFQNERSIRSIWFTDEKTFTFATPVNSQNDLKFILKQERKNKFLQRDSYANVNISVVASWFR